MTVEVYTRVADKFTIVMSTCDTADGTNVKPCESKINGHTADVIRRPSEELNDVEISKVGKSHTDHDHILAFFSENSISC